MSYPNYEFAHNIVTPTSHEIVFHIDSIKDERKILLTSDAHYDSAKCNRGLFKQHLEDARSQGALWIDNGDMFDAMQGRDDRRRQLDDLRPEYRVDHYYDAILGDTADFIEPYSDMLVLALEGNHESAVRKKAGTHLTERLAAELRKRRPGECSTSHGGYSSFVRVRMMRPNGSSASRTIFFHHGTGGGSRTMGIPKHLDAFGWCPDADVVVMGHNHKDYIIPVERIRCSTSGKLGFDVAYMVRIPGFKNAWGGADGIVGHGGWEVEKAFPPQTQGSCMLTFYYKGDQLLVQPDMMRR